MSTHPSALSDLSGVSRFHVSQAVSSARMVETMVKDELRRGEFGQTQSRVVRIEELVNEHLLEPEQERRLLLLAAELLEGSGETRKAYQLTGRLIADKERLGHDFLSSLRRFRARLALNAGDVGSARCEVSVTERTVMETLRGFGEIEQTVDQEDLSKVSAATWLLSAEISLAEREYERSLQDLADARSCMSRGVAKQIDESAMFELLSALVLVGIGDGMGPPALAHLYEMHVALRDESSVSASVRARIAAAAGDMGNIIGLSASEVARWRTYGPEPEVVQHYLLEGVSAPGLSDALSRLPPPSELLAAVDETLAMVQATRQPVAVAETVKPVLLPMSFLFEFFSLEEVTSMFDYNLKTGHLVVDWSDCDDEMLSTAVAAGAISELALRCNSATIYLNRGLYVDAVFDSKDPDLMAMSVQDVIFEIFRISTAGLSGAGARQFNGGSELVRIPERVSLRPNQFNLDLTKRLDHLRSGHREDQVVDDEVDIDLAFANWETATTVGQTVSNNIVSRRVEFPVSRSMKLLLGIFEAADVVSLQLRVIECLGALGLSGVRIEIELANCGDKFRECGLSAELCDVWATYTAGPLVMKVSFRKREEVSCGEEIDVVMKAAIERLRSLPAQRSDGVVESPGFIAADPVTQTLLSTLRNLAPLDGVSGGSKQTFKHLLLEGERGTGKELLARLIHGWSARAEEKFSVANLGAITKELAAAEIFGYKKGAFTGAENDHVGYVGRAERGTLFLDELDEADERMQALLKRVVEYRTYNVVGSAEELTCDVRFVAATNRVGAGEDFIKADLRDRFTRVRVPALRERRGDIGPLAQFFAGSYKLPQTVLGYFEGFEWPGNVRQLQAVVERVCLLAKSEEDITLSAFEASIRETGPNPAVVRVDEGGFDPLAVGETYKDRMNKTSRQLIKYYLDFTGWNKTNTASLLGMTRQNLSDLIRSRGIVQGKS
jgi:DNA-binding NtrC family response regulator